MSVLALHKVSTSAPAALPQWGPPARTADPLVVKPTLSVVIPAFNEARFITDSIRSVIDAKARYKGPVEIIVVDNNSTDATGEMARALGATVVFEPVNQIARARNAGARAATGDYLIFLDADTTLEGDIFEQVATNLSSGQVIGGGAWVEPDTGWFGRLLFKYAINYTLALKNLTVGPFLYCEAEAFRKVGGFDETLYAAEEFSLARRLKEAGTKDRKKWKIIKYDSGHRVVTSSRKFDKFGGLEMAFHNAHLIWRPHHKLRQKDHCRFWYEARKDD